MSRPPGLVTRRALLRAWLLAHSGASSLAVLGALVLLSGWLGPTVVQLPFIDGHGVRLQTILFVFALLALGPALDDRVAPWTLPAARPLWVQRGVWWSVSVGLALLVAVLGAPRDHAPWDSAVLGAVGVGVAYHVRGMLAGSLTGLLLGMFIVGTYVPEAGDGSGSPSILAVAFLIFGASLYVARLGKGGRWISP